MRVEIVSMTVKPWFFLVLWSLRCFLEAFIWGSRRNDEFAALRFKRCRFGLFVHFQRPQHTFSSVLTCAVSLPCVPGSSTAVQVVCYTLIGVGAFSMLMGFLGCLGAIYEIRCLLGLVSDWTRGGS